MDMKVETVRLEPGDPGKRGVLKALFALVCGNVRKARAALSGEQWLVALNADGEKIFAVSGGETMTVFVNGEKERLAYEEKIGGLTNTVSDLEQKLEVSDQVNQAIVSRQPVAVRKSLLAFRKPS